LPGKFDGFWVLLEFFFQARKMAEKLTLVRVFVYNKITQTGVQCCHDKPTRLMNRSSELTCSVPSKMIESWYSTAAGHRDGFSWIKKKRVNHVVWFMWFVR